MLVTVSLRPLQADDKADFVRWREDRDLWRFDFPDVVAGGAERRFQEWLAAPAAQRLTRIILAEGRPVGYVSATAGGDLTVCVGEPDWQRRGVGRQALALFVAGVCRPAGLQRLRAEVHPDNLACRALLGAAGFDQVAQVADRDPEGLPFHWLVYARAVSQPAGQGGPAPAP